MLTTTIPASYTVRGMAQAAGCELHNIIYILRSRKIKPQARHGTMRFFSPEVGEKVIALAREIAAQNHGNKTT